MKFVPKKNKQTKCESCSECQDFDYLLEAYQEHAKLIERGEIVLVGNEHLWNSML